MRHRHRPHDDGGDTLVEVLVALAVLSIGVTGLVSVLGTHASTTVVNRDASQVQTTLLSAAEHVKSLPFGGCTPTAWTAIGSTNVPRAAGLTVEYGDARQVGTVDCSKLSVVTVRITGNDFAGIAVDVVKRP